MRKIRFGRQGCGTLAESAVREWLVADGLGGFAMGTVAGLRTRRYHGLLVVATSPPIGRQLALASLDPVLVLGDRRVRLSSHEWAGGAVDPPGQQYLESFVLADGVPTWRWVVGEVALEATVAMADGRSAVGVVHRLVRAPGPVRIEVEALCTWRDVHGQRTAGPDPAVEATADGFVFEGAYRVAGPGFVPGGSWYRGVRYREEAERGLTDLEDLWFAGTFGAGVKVGETLEVGAWAGDLGNAPAPAGVLVAGARERARQVLARARPADEEETALVLAADQLVVAGPRVVAGYPWFGDWSRDTMTSYEGLLLSTGRFDEGRALLLAAAGSLSEGMLANTADVGGTEYNTVDGTLWFLHAVHRHVAVTGDLDLASSLVDRLVEVVGHHVQGTRFGIRMDADGLLTQGADGWALTWMDARVDGVPVTARAGKAVEVNALWVNGLAAVGDLLTRLGREPSAVVALEARARESFAERFPRRPGGGLLDVVDGPHGDDASLRPNQLLAVSLPFGPIRDPGPVLACAPLLTPLGLRSLDPADPAYRPLHRGGPAQRDAAYHQGTVWPWLIGPYVEAAQRVGMRTEGLLDGLVGHLGEWGLGSVSETTDGVEPNAATGCPFQAWSVAEVLRARRLMGGG